MYDDFCSIFWSGYIFFGIFFWAYFFSPVEMSWKPRGSRFEGRGQGGAEEASARGHIRSISRLAGGEGWCWVLGGLVWVLGGEGWVLGGLVWCVCVGWVLGGAE